MNTFREAIQMVIDTNQKLLDGSIDIRVANQVAINTQTIINAAKVQIEVMKLNKIDSTDFFNDTVKQSFDEVLKEIEERRTKPFQPTDKVDKIIENAHK